ncbi:MAG: 4Fe-4S binding protein [Ignavibacteriaceae bacterium]|nr:4Fe-4S binding protein [Ignavibacteriaceae bacterium]
MWRNYRRTAEVLQAILLTGLPFISFKGQSVLRFDLSELKLYFFGSVIWIKEFYLILAALLFFLVLIVFITAVFGRVWCGWLCPQTVLLDLTDSIAKRFGESRRKTLTRVLLIPFSALVSLTLIWYFVPPLQTMQSLFSSGPITGFFLVQWAVIYAELAFLGRKYCTTICPYSMMQNALFDKETLVIEYDRSRDDECMKCHDCVKVCPVGIDIKEGLKSDCIACAECIDACIAVTEKRNMKPFPGYRGNPLRPKSFWLGGAAFLTGVVFAAMVYLRPEVTFLISRDPERLPQGINRYSWSLYNNTATPRDLELSSGESFVIIGETTLMLEPYSFNKGKVLVRSEGGKDEVVFTVKGESLRIEKKVGFL